MQQSSFVRIALSLLLAFTFVASLAPVASFADGTGAHGGGNPVVPDSGSGGESITVSYDPLIGDVLLSVTYLYLVAL